MPEAVTVNDPNEIHVLAAEALSAGQVVPLSTTRVGVYSNIVSAAVGEKVTLRTAGVFELTALSTDTGSQDTLWYWDNTNNRATTTSSGNIRAGRGVGTKLSGETVVKLDLNAV